MKTLSVKHNNLDYQFEFFETTGEVSVVKDGKHTYTIVWEKPTQSWICDCPGARYHGYCWHRDVLTSLLTKPSLEEPWAQWAEEASVMRMERR